MFKVHKRYVDYYETAKIDCNLAINNFIMNKYTVAMLA